jgi:lysozyme
MRFEVSDRGLNFIKDWEKFRAKAYLDSKGVWTIGYGSTRVNGVPVRPGQVITEPQALAELRKDCRWRLDRLETLISAPLRQNQVDALLSLMYNIGDGGFAASSLRRAVNAGQGGAVREDLFTRWNKIRDPKTGQLIVLDGLTRRRRAEYQMYMETE